MPPTSRSRVFKYRGLLTAFVVIPVLVAWMLSEPHFLTETWSDVTFESLGWLLLAIGILLRLWATMYVGGRKSLKIVSGGPYAMCRHPLYVGSFLIITALACFVRNWTVSAAVMGAVLLHAMLVIPSEENHLRMLFAEAYDDYCRITPRFFPRLRRLRKPGFVEVKAAAFLRESVRDLGLVALAIIVHFVTHARMALSWPHLFRLP